MFAEEDENPFANAISPFNSSSLYEPSPTDYGAPLQTPVLDTEDKSNPYVQAILNSQPTEDPDLSLSIEPGRVKEDEHGTVFGDASGSGGGFQVIPPSESFKALDLVQKEEPSSYQAGDPSGFIPSSDFQPPTFQADLYDSVADPYLTPSSSSDILSTPAPLPSAPTFPSSPPSLQHSRKDSFDPLAAIFGQTEEEKMKSAFKKSSAISSSPAKKKDASKKTTAMSTSRSVVDDEEDPFASLIKNKKKPVRALKSSTFITPATHSTPTTAPLQSNNHISSCDPASSEQSPLNVSFNSDDHASEDKLNRSGDHSITPKASIIDLPKHASTVEPPVSSEIPHEETSTPLAPAEVALPESRVSTPLLPQVSLPPSEPDPAIPSPLQTPYPSTFQHAPSSSSSSSSSSSTHGTYIPTPPQIERSLSSITLPPPGGMATPTEKPWSVNEYTGGGGWGAAGGGGWSGEEEGLGVRREASNVAFRGTGEDGSFSSALHRDESVQEEDDETETTHPEDQVASSTVPIPADADSTESFGAAAAKVSKIMDIKVGDPTKKGIGATGHIVYTVTTRHLVRGGEISVLRRFSDFLWLFGTLQSNNPGVIVPPVPDKHPFGRFAEEFVETRRNALEKCIQKIANHPVLQVDGDLRIFLQSDSLSLDMKNRKTEQASAEQKGYLASLTSSLAGPKFHERDEWFDDKKSILDTLESQLKALVKSIELVSKQRLDLASTVSDFADSISSLAGCDLSKQLSHALDRFADIGRKIKDVQEENAKGDVVTFMTTSDEHIRLITSVRLAFASRIKTYIHHQNLESEVRRLRSAFEKARRAGKVHERGPEAQGVVEAERRAKEAEAEFASVSRLVKTEYARFENERVEDFKNALDALVEGIISRQKVLISAWEDFHQSLLRLVQQNVTPAHPRPVNQAQIEVQPPTIESSESSVMMSPPPSEAEEKPKFRVDDRPLPTEPLENAWA